jgi:ketosteroid isomerase-like protein
MELEGLEGGRKVAGKCGRVILGLALGVMMTWAAAGAESWGQLPLPDSGSSTPNPLTEPTATPGKTLLYSLESQFGRAVAQRGGAGFASWFADDGVILGNGKPPVVGRVAIEKSATWSPANYQLSWTPDGAWMNAAGDSGYTWGHYDGQSKDANGNPVIVGGRYFTVWGKQAGGSWKVELEASANEPPEAGSCCKLPGR